MNRAPFTFEYVAFWGNSGNCYQTLLLVPEP
jgi:hypothetical protein